MSSTTEMSVSLHEVGAVPTGFVAQHAPDLRQGSISQRPIQAALARSAFGAHTGGVQRFDHDHLVLLGQCGGGLVQHVAAYDRGVGVCAADPGLVRRHRFEGCRRVWACGS